MHSTLGAVIWGFPAWRMKRITLGWWGSPPDVGGSALDGSERSRGTWRRRACSEVFGSVPSNSVLRWADEQSGEGAGGWRGAGSAGGCGRG